MHHVLSMHPCSQVIEQPKNIGLTGQWTQSWFPTSDTEIILIIEDDMAVVPDYYIWLKKMIHTYYLDPAQYDSRMFGITLQNQVRTTRHQHILLVDGV